MIYYDELSEWTEESERQLWAWVNKRMKINKGDWIYQRLQGQPEQLARAAVILERAWWNMARHDASALLGQLEKQIRKNGGIRQWTEGLPLLRRVKARLKEWVN